jgi:hypothetical protein
LTKTGMGSLGPLKGRWLKTLVETYVKGVRPPDNTIGIIEQGVIRYCMAGKGLTAEETRAVVKSLRGRLPDQSFSDRLLHDEAELDRVNEYLLKDPLAYLPDPERSRAIWRKVDAYCARIGFDIRHADTWKLPEAGQPKLELAKSATVLALSEFLDQAELTGVVPQIRDADVLLREHEHANAQPQPHPLPHPGPGQCHQFFHRLLLS